MIGIEAYFFNLIKRKKPTANIILNGQDGMHSFYDWEQDKESALIALNIVPEGRNKMRKVNGIYVGKEEVKLSLFVHEMINYVEDLKVSIKILLKLLSEFSKIQDKHTRINCTAIYK